jgi:hypothetical protein
MTPVERSRWLMCRHYEYYRALEVAGAPEAELDAAWGEYQNEGRTLVWLSGAQAAVTWRAIGPKWKALKA